MDLKLQIAQSDESGTVIDSQTIEIAGGSRLTVDFSTNIQLLRDGNLPARVAPLGENLIVQWEDGEFLILEPLEGTFDPAADEPREVSINGVLISGFGNDTDQAQLDSFMQWGANYEDSPLPWAPLPIFMEDFPEEIEHLPIEEPEEEAAAVPVEEPENNAPVIEGATMRVSEEGLRGANPDTVGSSDTTNLSSRSGTISVSDPDGDPLVITLEAPADGAVESGGVPVVWSGSGSAKLVGTAGGNTVATITIDNSGNYTVSLQAPLTHGVANVEDEESFAVKVIASDGTDSSQAILDVIAEDDSPIIDVERGEGTPESLVTDESFLGEAGATDTGSFASNFDLIANSYGADGAGKVTTSYVLGIDTSSPTGLVDTATGNAVVLSMTSGGAVEGHATSGELVFTLTGDGAGGVKLTQWRAVVHTPDTGPDQPTTLSSANLVTMTQTSTIVDKDGDSQTDSAVLGIGQALVFEDDGPSIEVGTTGTPESLVVDESFLGGAGATDTGSFATNFTVDSDYGADGAGKVTTSYVLGIDTSSPTGLVDTATGNAVVLSMTSGGAVEGHATSGELVFTLTGDGAGGVKLTQWRAVMHTPDTGPDQPTTLSSANLVTMTQTSTIVDKDGDSQTDSAVLGIGQALVFEDDGPSIEVGTTGTPESLVVDESFLGGAGATDTGSFATNFTVDSDYGADGAGKVTTSYVLGIDTSSPTGLVDTATGNAVVLSMTSGGAVEGHATSGELVFTLTGDGAGGVKLTQWRAVVHTPDTGPDQPTTLSSANLVTMTQTSTIVDKDGDSQTDSAVLGIGQALVFEDDGPSVTVTPDMRPDTLTLDESPVPDAGDGLRTVSASFADNFDSGLTNFGADGAGSVAYTLALSASGIGSGLYALDPTDADAGDGDGYGQGSEILLSQASSTAPIIGAVGGTIYFQISIDGNTGEVTFTQGNNIWHPVAGSTATAHDDADWLTLEGEGEYLAVVKTVIDADGDTDSAFINLGAGVFSIEDDGPSVTVTPDMSPDTLTLDESPVPDAGDGLRTVSASFADNFDSGSTDFGTDGAGSVAYTLALNENGIGSGLYALDSGDRSTEDEDGYGQGSEILLSQSSSTAPIFGSVGKTIYFQISIDGNTGEVTFTQFNNIWHPLAGSTAAAHDDAAWLKVEEGDYLRVVKTVTDADADTAAAFINLGAGVFSIQDDGPDVIIPEDTSLYNAAGESITGNLDLDANIDPEVGTDQIGSVRFSNITDGQETDYFSGGEPIQLYLNAAKTELSGRINGADGDEIFRITLQPDGDIDDSSDIYEVELFAQIDNGAGVSFEDLTGTGPAGNPPWKVVESGEEGQDLLFTPINAHPFTVNSDSDDIAVGGQFIDWDAALRIDFADVTLLNKSGDPIGPKDQVEDYQIESHNTVSNFSFTIDQVSSGTYADIELRAYSANDDKDWDNDTPLNITQVDVYDDNGDLVAEATGTGTVGGLDFDFTGDEVSVRGLLADYRVVTSTEDGYSRLEVMNAGVEKNVDGKFSISHLEMRAIITGEDIDMSYDIQLVDADGDFTDASLQFTLEAERSESEDLLSDDEGVEGLLQAASLSGPDASYLEPDDGEGGDVATVPDDLAPVDEPPPAV